MERESYEFDGFLLNARERTLSRGGVRIPLQPKVVDLLELFLIRNGEVLGRDEIMKSLWPDAFVEESNLRFCIHSLRRALGKKDDGTEFVETFPKRGYRLNADLEPPSTAAPESAVADHADSDVRGDAFAETSIKRVHASRHRVRLLAAAVVAIAAMLVAASVFLSTRSAPTSKNSLEHLAVAPFEVTGGTGSELGAKFTDVLVLNLRKLRAINVVRLPETAESKGVDAISAARANDATTVLVGTVFVAGDNVNVTAEIRPVDGGEPIWSETFSVKGTSPDNAESVISMRIGNRISRKFADLEEQALVAADGVPPEVAADFLAARRIWRTGELHRRAEMVVLMERVVAAQPGWTRAWAAYCELLTASDQMLVKWDLVQSKAERSIEMGAVLPQPHVALGEKFRWVDWNWPAAENSLKQAIKIDPNYSRSYYVYSGLLRTQRRFAEAEENILKAIDREPFSPLFYSSLCELYWFDRKYEKAMAACRTAEQIDPEFWLIRKLLYHVYLDQNRIDDLRDLIVEKLPEPERASHLLTAAAQTRDLTPYLKQWLIDLKKAQRPNPVTEAAVHLRLGDAETALAVLNRALEERDFAFPMANADPAFWTLRNDRRFLTLMQKAGL